MGHACNWKVYSITWKVTIGLNFPDSFWTFQLVGFFKYIFQLHVSLFFCLRWQLEKYWLERLQTYFNIPRQFSQRIWHFDICSVSMANTNIKILSINIILNLIYDLNFKKYWDWQEVLHSKNQYIFIINVWHRGVWYFECLIY